MSQITCCPSCGTKFKVVADQLRISEGWVRCGQCKEIFDASAHMQAVVAAPLLPDFPLEEGAVAHAAPVVPAPALEPVAPLLEVPGPVVPAFLAVPALPPVAVVEPAEPMPAEAEAVPEEAPGLAPEVAEVAEVAEAPAEDALEFPALLPVDPWVQEIPQEASAEVPGEPAGDAVPATAPPAVPAAATPPAPVQPPPSSEEEDVDGDATPEPGFVRAARRQAFWHSAGVRFVLLLLCLAALAGLAAQMAVHQRNALAAAQPQLRPWLEQACVRLGCAIGPDRRIAAVAIDSSGFVKAGRGDSYQLTLAIKNLSGAAVAMPAVELTLTDAQDQAVLRRVLLPAELEAPVELAAHGEWSGQTMVVLAGPALRLSGYRVLAFYP
ncbi:MAG: hypothetical protein ABT02_07215 [Comamonadaceae bacterium SCN 68-20]|nr:MAG: hypothetical protein ABT02_07215 [Comamonadaceae bacterium SCN 68-20]OJX05662.1 MAG: hypothetical protein BGO75_15935 [Burkholderiales bacterium 68-20]